MQLILILTPLKYVYCTRDCCFDTVKVGVLTYGCCVNTAEVCVLYTWLLHRLLSWSVMRL